MEREVIIKAENLHKAFGDRHILNGTTFDIYKGETFVIIGGSGCGKSTLLRHLIGTLKPDIGKVSLLGKELDTLDDDGMDEVRKRIGMCFQSSALFDSMTVGENIALPLKEHTKLDDNVINIVIKMKLELVGLRGFEDLLPSQLSGGMRKRVGLARAIVMDPQVVFYDEPSAGLDPIVAAVIDKLMLDLSKKLSITSVVVTHDMRSVFRIADRIAMLHDGKVLQIGTKEEIKNSDNPLIRQFIHGQPDGPVSFMQKGDDYIESLTK